MTSQYHYGIYSQNRAAERHILQWFTVLTIVLCAWNVNSTCMNRILCTATWRHRISSWQRVKLLKLEILE